MYPPAELPQKGNYTYSRHGKWYAVCKGRRIYTEFETRLAAEAAIDDRLTELSKGHEKTPRLVQNTIDAADYYAVTQFRAFVEDGRMKSHTTRFETIQGAAAFRDATPNTLIYACTNAGRYEPIPEYQVQRLLRGENNG